MVAVVSDGSAVLGLGNLGPEGALPVMEGKAMLFKELAGINAFPIVLGTQNEDEIVQAVLAIAPSFGGINLEDISAPRCFSIEKRLKEKLNIPVMHDDQHGTAIVVLAGLINAFKVAKKKLGKSTVVISGAGAAGSAVARLLFLYGVGTIIVCDSQGIIFSGRPGLSKEKKDIALFTNKEKMEGGLAEALFGADAFVGVSGPGLLKPEFIKSMHSKPIIFALANPTPEILPDVAQKAGAFIVATGRSDFPNQVNNALGFPGIFRGALDHGVREITDNMKLKAARAIARLISKPNRDKIIPSVFDKKVVPAVAKAIR
jgi:malate dehydrogenase (oxaloacetate-decarboxylating)